MEGVPHVANADRSTGFTRWLGEKLVVARVEGNDLANVAKRFQPPSSYQMFERVQ
jgi:hypothetical protein